MEFLKKNGVSLLTLLLCVCTLVTVFQQKKEIDHLSGRVGAMKSSLYEMVSNVPSQIVDALEEADKLTEHYEVEPLGVDAETNSLQTDVTVTLKEWSEDMAVTLLAVVAGQEFDVPMEFIGDGVFRTPLPLPIESGVEIRLNLLIAGREFTTRESLGGWTDISMLMPLQRGNCSSMGWHHAEKGSLSLTEYFVGFENRNQEFALVHDPIYRIYRNGEAVIERPGLLQEESGVGAYQYTSGAWETPIACEPGDELVVAFVCRDDYGLGYEWVQSRLLILEDGVPEERWYEGDEYPRLFWEVY